MNQIIKQEWVTALKSGDYKQGKGKLRDNNTFCCLGVLCDIYHKYYPETSYWLGGQFTTETSKSSYLLPKPVREWSEINSRLEVYDDNIPRSLPGLNDSGESFETIANLINESL